MVEVVVGLNICLSSLFLVVPKHEQLNLNSLWVLKVACWQLRTKIIEVRFLLHWLRTKSPLCWHLQTISCSRRFFYCCVLNSDVTNSLVDLHWGFTTMSRGFHQHTQDEPVGPHDYSVTAWMTHNKSGEYVPATPRWDTTVPHTRWRRPQVQDDTSGATMTGEVTVTPLAGIGLGLGLALFSALALSSLIVVAARYRWWRKPDATTVDYVRCA